MPTSDPPESSFTSPALIYGTAWKKERTAALVEQAVTLGFRGIDTACQPKHYDESGVGKGIAACLSRGVARHDLYLQTKFTALSGQDPKRVPYDTQAPLDVQVAQSCAVSLRQLGTSYLDCLLLHSPQPSMTQTMVAWRAMERLVEQGHVRTLGLSNCYECESFDQLWQLAKIKPRVLQNRFYQATGYDVAIRQYCLSADVNYQSFWTLTANPHVLSHKVVHELARQYAVTEAQVLLRYLTQVGVTPLTGTTSRQHMRDDLEIFRFSLELDEVTAINELLV